MTRKTVRTYTVPVRVRGTRLVISFPDPHVRPECPICTVGGVWDERTYVRTYVSLPREATPSRTAYILLQEFTCPLFTSRRGSGRLSKVRLTDRLMPIIPSVYSTVFTHYSLYSPHITSHIIFITNTKSAHVIVRK